jgi:hypothetical protein
MNADATMPLMKMFVRWILSLQKRREVRRIVRALTEEDRAFIRSRTASDLISLHFTLGGYIRNGFRSGKFPGLFSYCDASVRQSGEPMSFDALSNVALHEIWKHVKAIAGEK